MHGTLTEVQQNLKNLTDLHLVPDFEQSRIAINEMQDWSLDSIRTGFFKLRIGDRGRTIRLALTLTSTRDTNSLLHTPNSI